MQDKKGHVRRSRKEWAGILQRFDSSGLAPQEYCRREGLPLSSFQRWRSRLTTGTTAEFVELGPSSPESTRSGWELEVILPHGVRLQFRG
jgi:hypothetical protein